MKKKLWDVVIYEIATGKIDTIAGKDMVKTGSFHTVEKRINTLLPRLNEQYSVKALPAGKYKVGDVIVIGRIE